MKKILFDIGANNGSTSIPWLADNNNIIYAFEPTPFLYESIINTIIDNPNRSNYHIIKSAVSNYNGVSIFYIAGQNDWGTSSLLEYSENLDIKWPDRTDFKVTETIDTEVIRLDSFIRNNNIDSIDYLHVDTQGSDLNVLYGLGEYISIVKEGTIEAAYKNNILYKNQNTVNESCIFLINNGFTISKIEPNDDYENEANIKFKK